MSVVLCPRCGKEIIAKNISPSLNERISCFARTGYFEDKDRYVIICGCSDEPIMQFTIGPGIIGKNRDRVIDNQKRFVQGLKKEADE